MATATKRTSSTKAEHAPPPVGCAAYERADWLNSIPVGLDWLHPLREKQRTAAYAFSDAVAALADIRAQRHDAEAAYRRAVRDGLAASEPAPERPPELDPARREAALTIGREEVDDAREVLSGIVVDSWDATGHLRDARISRKAQAVHCVEIEDTRPGLAPHPGLTESHGPAPTARDRMLIYVIAPAVSGAALLRMTKMTLLTRTKTRRSTNPMRSSTSPNEAMTPPRPKP